MYHRAIVSQSWATLSSCLTILYLSQHFSAIKPRHASILSRRMYFLVSFRCGPSFWGPRTFKVFYTAKNKKNNAKTPQMDVGAPFAQAWWDVIFLIAKVYLPTVSWNPSFPQPHLVAVQVQIVQVALARPRSLLSKKSPPLKLHSWDFSPRPRPLLSRPLKTKNPLTASDHTAVWAYRAEGGEPLGLIAVQVLVSRGVSFCFKKFLATKTRNVLKTSASAFCKLKKENSLSDVQTWLRSDDNLLHPRKLTVKRSRNKIKNYTGIDPMQIALSKKS